MGQWKFVILPFLVKLGFWGAGAVALLDSSSIPVPMDAILAVYVWIYRRRQDKRSNGEQRNGTEREQKTSHVRLLCSRGPLRRECCLMARCPGHLRSACGCAEFCTTAACDQVESDHAVGVAQKPLAKAGRQ